jgi:hypothetical protein
VIVEDVVQDADRVDVSRETCCAGPPGPTRYPPVRARFSRARPLLPRHLRLPSPGLHGYDNTQAPRDGAGGGGTMPPRNPAASGDAVEIRRDAATVTSDARTG